MRDFYALAITYICRTMVRMNLNWFTHLSQHTVYLDPFK